MNEQNHRSFGGSLGAFDPMYANTGPAVHSDADLINQVLSSLKSANVSATNQGLIDWMSGRGWTNWWDIVQKIGGTFAQNYSDIESGSPTTAESTDKELWPELVQWVAQQYVKDNPATQPASPPIASIGTNLPFGRVVRGTGTEGSTTSSSTGLIIGAVAVLAAAGVGIWAFGRKSTPAPASSGAAGNPAKGNWALVKAVGMDDQVLSVHATREAAEKAMRKRGGEPDSLFTKGMHIVDVGPGGGWEMIEIFGGRTIRPRRSRNPAKSYEAIRYIGDAVIHLNYDGSHDPHMYYSGVIKAGRRSWKFDGVGVSSYVHKGAADAPEAFDMAAAAAAGFGSYYSSDNRGDDTPEWAPSPQTADAIYEAVSWAQDERGEYTVLRRKPARK